MRNKAKREVVKIKIPNTVNTVFELQGGNSKIVPVQSFEFTIDYAPDGAEYGKFWNEPTLANNIKKGKTKNIPQSINFAEKAILTPEFQRGLDELVDLLGETIATNIVKDL